MLKKREFSLLSKHRETLICGKNFRSLLNTKRFERRNPGDNCRAYFMRELPRAPEAIVQTE